MFIYIAAIVLCLSGLYMTIASWNYIAKIIGLTIFQNSILLFYIALGKVYGGVLPIDAGLGVIYSSPVPQVLMLTAIVVGFATISVALALASQIHANFGSLTMDDLNMDDITDEFIDGDNDSK